MRARDRLARHGWWLVIAFAYLYAFPYFPKIQSANELPRVYLTRAIVDDHTFAIDRGVKTWGSTGDVSPYAGHQYSNKAPGSSLLAVPAYAAVSAIAGEPSLAASVWLCRAFAGIAPMLAFLALLWRYLARFAPDPAVRRLVVLAYALGSLAMTYSLLFYSHQLAAICAASAAMVAHDGLDRRRGRAAFAASGALAGAAIVVDYQAAFALVPIAIWIAARLVRWPRLDAIRAIGLAVAGAALPIAGLLAYHAACFGSPWRTGYAVSETYASYHQQGLLGLSWPRLRALYGIAVAPDNGLFALSPWLVLVIPGTVLLVRRRDGVGVGVGVGSGERGAAIAYAAVIAVMLWFGASLTFWRGGWEVGPRYITALVPFALPAIAAQLQAWRERRVAIAIAAGAIAIGVAIYALTTVTFPYWPAQPESSAPFADPLVDVTFRLIADGLGAPSIATAVGAPAVASVAIYAAIVLAALAAAVWRVAGGRAVAIAGAVAALGLAAFALVSHGGGAADRAYAAVVRPAVIDSLGSSAP